MEWHILSFDNWCFHAAAHIRFKPDRPAVEQELREHMEDHFNALLAEGKTAQEAERLTLAAMGDADETGAALARVHKPYLGWLYVAAKWVVALSAILLFMVSCSSGFDFPAFGFSAQDILPPAQLWQTFAVSLFHLCNPQKRPGSFLHIALEPALNTYVLSRVLLHLGRKHPYVQSDGIRLPMLPFAQSSEKVVKLFLRHNFPIATAFRRWND